MEKTDIVSSPQLGPSRTGSRSAGDGRTLSAPTAALLDQLRVQSGPLGMAGLVAATGLHENTLREHLAALVARGLVRRHRAEPSGRGRPAWLYELAAEMPVVSEYAGLAAALAATIARTSDDPAGAAAVSGEDWGRELARGRGAATLPTAALPAAAARDQVVGLLEDLGFEPERSVDHPEEVRLTRCPLLEAAHRHPAVVCAVHLGIVRGALATYGGDPEGSTLVPFAEPGACLLVIPPRDGD